MNILLIDDSEQLRQSLKNILHDIEGVTTVHECHCGNDALSLLEAHQPDTVILDIHLGDCTGFDVLNQFRTCQYKPTVIIFTAHPYPQYREQSLKDGADFFIDKSSADELVETLEQLIQTGSWRQ